MAFTLITHWRRLVSMSALALAAGFALVAPATADAHRLSVEGVEAVVYNTLAADWTCRPLGRHRVDCARADYDEGCQDIVQFRLIGRRLYWRPYEDGCRTWFRDRPALRGHLTPVPAGLLYSLWTSGRTSQGRPIGVRTFRQYLDNGRFSFGSVSTTSFAVDMRCSDGRNRSRFVDYSWEDASIRRSGTFRASEGTGALSRTSIAGRARGPHRTLLNGTIRVERRIGRTTRCTSGRVRFALSAHPIALF